MPIGKRSPGVLNDVFAEISIPIMGIMVQYWTNISILGQIVFV
jgi:hypothetical protein